MKLALFADIHSNLEAITACLAHADALGADRYAFLGDLVGYGADPVAVLDLIEGHAANGAVVVLGNHDAAALGRPDDTLNANAHGGHRLDAGAARRAAAGVSRRAAAHRRGGRPACSSTRAPRRRSSGSTSPDLRRRKRACAPATPATSSAGTCTSRSSISSAPTGGRCPSGRCPGTPIPVGSSIGSGSPSSVRPGSRATATTRRATRSPISDRERLTFFRVPYDHGRGRAEDPRGRASRAARAAPRTRSVDEPPGTGQRDRRLSPR